MYLKNTLYTWIQANRIILTNASSLMSTTAVTSVLGFIYWWMAARYFPAAAVGLASAAVSAMMLLSSVSTFGLGTLLIGELPRQPDRRASLIVTALAVVATAGVVLGTLFALLAPLLSTDLQPLAGSAFAVALFAISVALSSATIVLDQAVIGLFRSGLQLWRNVLFAMVKLALLVSTGLWLVTRTGITIYTTWVVGSASSVLLFAFVAARSGLSWRAYRLQWGLLKELRKSALGHHALNLTLQGPSLALPVLTTALLSATTNAYFYAAWMVARFVFVGPISLAVVLHAMGVARAEVLALKIRHSLTMSLAVGVAANVAVLAGAEPLLSVFGHNYADQAAWSLRLLAVAVFPLTIRYHYIALARIQGWMGKAAVVMAVGAVLELSMAAIGARRGGLTGLSLGWVAATCLEAAFMARPVYRVLAAAATLPTAKSPGPLPAPSAAPGIERLRGRPQCDGRS